MREHKYYIREICPKTYSSFLVRGQREVVGKENEKDVLWRNGRRFTGLRSASVTVPGGVALVSDPQWVTSVVICICVNMDTSIDPAHWSDHRSRQDGSR